MNSVDKISRETKVIIENAKDTFVQNLVGAARTNKISLDDSQLSSIINLLNISVDESFQKAIPVFQRTVKSFISSKTEKSK